MKIPYNMEYEVDHSLREVPKDQTSMPNEIQFLINESLDKTGVDKARLLSRIGVYQRICGELERSLTNLIEAKSLMRRYGNLRLNTVTNLRIAQTLQFLQRFDESEQLFSKLGQEIQNDEELKDLLDFVYQHHGKLYFEQKKFNEALQLFHKALQLRKLKNEQELINSTLLAIEVTKRQGEQ